ncbi:MAG: helix-turn-helix domain-containing protein [Dehalococcoidia bacterium]|jgi:transcriptional regulator with XRE-family HTH domain
MKRNVIGARVRQARKMASPQISQIDLVARLQVLGLKIEQAAISKIENGKRPVLDTEVALIAKALDVSVAWLLGESKTPKRSSK